MRRGARRTPLMALALAALVSLAGCSPLTSDADNEAIYRLAPGALPRDVLAGLPRPLSLDRVRVPAALATDKIRISLGDGRLDHYTNARWAGPLPDTLNDAITRLLGDPEPAAVVATEARPERYRLRVNARDFQAHYRDGATAQPPQLHVTLVLTLLDSDGRVLARSRIQRRADSEANQLDEVIAGLERTLRSAFKAGINELTAERGRHDGEV